MAEPIRQEFIIDARTAVQTLTTLDNAFDRFGNQLRETSRNIADFNRITGENRNNVQALGRNVGTLARNLNRLSASNPGERLAAGFDATENQARQVRLEVERLSRATRQARTRSTNLTVSWQTLARVFATQIFVQVLNRIRDATREAVVAASELEKRFALITTIQPGSNIESIGEAVRGISDNLNIDQLEVARGLYDAISNQVSDLFEETVRFTEASGEFARATGSTLSDAVDLLSGAIRSYGLTVDDVDRVQGIFFDAIDKGRITADELANTFGRVGPAARSLGISLEEVAGTVASISDRGLSAAESLTAMRGIIIALTKPTEQLTTTLEGLGFDSGETAIQTLGFTETLRALVGATDGSQQALAKLFPRVRGLTGVLAGANDNFETLEANIRSATEAGDNFEGRQFLQATSTDAEVVTGSIRRIKNEFIELGGEVLSTAAEIIRTFRNLSDGVDVVAATFDAASAALIPITSGVVIASVVALTASFGPLGLAAAVVVGTLTALVVATAAIRKSAVEDINATTQAIIQANQERIDSAREAAIESVNAQKAVNDEIVRNASKRVSVEALEQRQRLQLIQQFNSQVVASIEQTVDSVTGAFQKIVDETRDAIVQADTEIERSGNRIQTLRDKLADRERDRALEGRSEAEQVFALTTEAADKASEASQLLSRGTQEGDENLLKRARALFGAAEELAGRAESIAGDDLDLRRRAQQTGSDIIQSEIAAEEQRVRLIGTQKELAKQILPEEEKRLQLVKAIGEQIKENIDLLQTGGDSEAIRAQVRALEDGIRNLQDVAGQESKALDLLGFGRVGAQIQEQIQTGIATLPSQISDQRSQVAQAVSSLVSIINQELEFVPSLSELLGRDLVTEAVTSGSLGVITRGLDEARDSANDLFQTQQRSNTASFEFGVRIEDAAAALDGIGNELPERLIAARDSLRSIVEDSKITREELSAASEVFDRLAPGVIGQFFAGLNSDEARAGIENLQTASDSIISAFQIAEQSEVFSQEDQKTLLALNSTLLNIGETVRDPMTEGATAVANAGQQFLSDILDARQQLLGLNVEVTTTATTSAQQFGGFFQDGGVTRGKDTSLAAIQAGERITDARNSAKFFPQLTAIGAGRAPNFRSQGDVTTVGDVNISVNGGQSNPQTAREIGLELRRLIKRGQLKL